MAGATNALAQQTKENEEAKLEMIRTKNVVSDQQEIEKENWKQQMVQTIELLDLSRSECQKAQVGDSETNEKTMEIHRRLRVEWARAKTNMFDLWIKNCKMEQARK